MKLTEAQWAAMPPEQRELFIAASMVVLGGGREASPYVLARYEQLEAADMACRVAGRHVLTTHGLACGEALRDLGRAVQRRAAARFGFRVA